MLFILRFSWLKVNHTLQTAIADYIDNIDKVRPTEVSQLSSIPSDQPHPLHDKLVSKLNDVKEHVYGSPALVALRSHQKKERATMHAKENNSREVQLRQVMLFCEKNGTIKQMNNSAEKMTKDHIERVLLSFGIAFSSSKSRDELADQLLEFIKKKRPMILQSFT